MQLVMDDAQWAGLGYDTVEEYIVDHLSWTHADLRKYVTQTSFDQNSYRLKASDSRQVAMSAFKIQAGFRGKKSRKRVNQLRKDREGAVSYTHLTLPTLYSV
eukprot:TRINITY_DN28606_c0_g1_i1.p1 TRINITY_DN28606_c0_g1~~TRINITY_DN28606_c0_g1_i1.p1  ORF type:complete len:102 (-),score=24.49 TRINITY_DN28606_c0_g1_i1:10-315(-)